MSNSTQTSPTLTLRRTFAADRETVFAAFTDPATLRKWLAPHDCTMTDVAFEPQIGGAFRFVYNGPKFGEMTATGVVTALRRPEHLAFSWSWDEDDEADRHESAVRIDFIERGRQTEIVFVHERLASDESRDRHENGWSGALDHLAELLGG